MRQLLRLLLLGIFVCNSSPVEAKVKHNKSQSNKTSSTTKRKPKVRTTPANKAKDQGQTSQQTQTSQQAQTSKNEIMTADYVVIGMGTSGAGIAKILSDDMHTAVIGIEAGANHDHDAAISSSANNLALSTQYYPNYFYQLDQTPNSVKGDSFPYTGGRLFGGSSSVNGQQFVRGTVENYTEWQNLLGPDWSVEKIQQTFKDLETYNGSSDNVSARGVAGPLNIRQAPSIASTKAEKLVQAIYQATGFNEIVDYNNPSTPLGPFTKWQLTENPDGTRSSSSTAYLKGIVDANGKGIADRNLTILANTTALRILFNKNQAVGVQVLQEGVQRTIMAKKKVILSAGVFSPFLLLQSGIGPREQLESLGIPVVSDLPVGQFMENHPYCIATFSANPNDIGIPQSDPHALYVGGAFLPDPSPEADSTRRAVECVGLDFGPNSLGLLISPLRCMSRGQMALQSSDPHQAPLVSDGALSDQMDMETMKNVFRTYVLEIGNQLQNIDPNYQLVSPSPAIINDDAQLEAYIEQTFGIAYNWTGTCKMAPKNQDGVVDTRGEVYGVTNLVVADGTILPFIADGSTQASAYMVGRMIANQILAAN